MNLLFSLLVSLAVLSSPDGRLNVSIETSSEGLTGYSISYDNAEVMPFSRLGLKADFTDFSTLEFLGSEQKDVRVNYSLKTIKKSEVDYQAKRYILHFQNNEGAKMDIEWQLSNTDAAFRYTVLRFKERGSIRVMQELSSFSFPEGSLSWLCPQSDAMVGWKRTKPSYEEFYSLEAKVGTGSEFGHGFTFPCLFRTGSGVWVLVSETGVDGSYCGSHLSDYQDGSYSIAFPMMEENNGNGTVEPAFALPGSTPWRTLTVSPDISSIAQSTITFDLPEQKYPASYDYAPGKSTWSWILWQDDSINYDDQVAFVDLASELGYPYCLVDAFWDKTIGRERIEVLSSYAASKGVNLFMWYSSSGWWNDIEQSPTDIMCDPIKRKKEMRWLRSIGVKGIKVDFFGGDKQETIRLYESILSDADDNGLMVIFHGCTLPRGWEKMYPNYVGSEAVRASENLVFNQSDCDIEAQSACLHPFIRNAVGCMEFGGTFLNKRLSRTNETPDSKGRLRGNVRRTSDAFQLATAVVFQNPVQNFALAPNNLEDAPGAAISFMKEVPTLWDDTRCLGGYPGKWAVIARRSSGKWYVGALNADSEALTLDIKQIEKALGASVSSALYTEKGCLKSSIGKEKRLVIPKEDGAVLILE